MTKPLIGILGNLLVTDGGTYSGMERAFVNHEYVEAVELAGGAPMMLPVVCDAEVIEKQIACVDGILIPGGCDVNPLCYGEEPLQGLGFIDPEIDEYYFKAIEYCTKHQKPILGICKGMQVLNVAFGGTLYQDLSYIEGSTLKHIQNAKRSTASHVVEIEEESVLFGILGGKTITNSFHHQSVKQPAPGFKITAVAKDGVVEAIEKVEGNLIIGVQWHPEGMVRVSESMLNLFRWLIQASMVTL